ncbi:hypothetical protein E4U09_002203 [Claviceps aff. purpurea]|uniref:Uncharacterized protein n=1 Tax=Claviceps aff. purpurea TaxID=1967640 RepID=A0A9P7QL34_9HYPO|nr:hypothetical protein E4U09_002203 [Claviceps aff. purpurea]
MGFPPKPRTDWLLTVPFPGPGRNTGTTGSEQRPERPKLQQKTAKSQDQTPCHAMPCHAEHSVFLPVPSEVSSCYGQAIRAAGSVRVPYASEQTPQSPRAYDTPGVHVQRKKGLGRIVEPSVENGLAAGRLTADG